MDGVQKFNRADEVEESAQACVSAFGLLCLTHKDFTCKYPSDNGMIYSPCCSVIKGIAKHKNFFCEIVVIIFHHCEEVVSIFYGTESFLPKFQFNGCIELSEACVGIRKIDRVLVVGILDCSGEIDEVICVGLPENNSIKAHVIEGKTERLHTFYLLWG